MKTAARPPRARKRRQQGLGAAEEGDEEVVVHAPGGERDERQRIATTE